jgi:hypothetical protein
MDGHTGAGQVDFHIGNLPRGLNAEDLAVKLAVVHETGLESGPAGSLSELLNPHKTGKSLQKFINDTDERIVSITMELGTGVGDDFVPLTFEDDGVAFEMRTLVPREFFEGSTGAPDRMVWNPQRFAHMSPKAFDDGLRPRFDPASLMSRPPDYFRPRTSRARKRANSSTAA